MNKIGKALAMAGAPVALAGMLIGGAAGFTSAAPATLKQVSDKITFTGTLLIGGSNFAINSTTCQVTDKDSGATFPCHLGGAGSINGTTSISDVSVSGPDGVVTWHQTTTRVGLVGCATGTGLEISDDHVSPEPVRIEGTSLSIPQSSNVIAVSGTITVYEQGGSGIIGIGCTPD